MNVHPRPQVMRLTEAAAERIRALQAGSVKSVEGVRIGVKNGGCAGMEYTMEYAEARGPHDEVVEDKGVKLLIDPTAVMFLLGTEMDYRTDRMRSGFVFNNPNQTSACGCGESVMLKPAGDAPEKLRDSRRRQHSPSYRRKLSSARAPCLSRWIPACAGMTKNAGMMPHPSC